MKDALKPGLSFEFKFKVTKNKTVPHLYPESPEFQVMPEVFATGYMVGLIEWACIRVINPHIEWPQQQSVGIGIEVSHIAATPPGLTVTVKGELEKVEGRKLIFSVVVHDGIDTIAEGIHERFIINAAEFNAKAAVKAEKAKA